MSLSTASEARVMLECMMMLAGGLTQEQATAEVDYAVGFIEAVSAARQERLAREDGTPPNQSPAA